MRRKLPTMKAIIEKAAEMCCQHPDLCGDGWNPWDCGRCQARAWLSAQARRGK